MGGTAAADVVGLVAGCLRFGMVSCRFRARGSAANLQGSYPAGTAEKDKQMDARQGLTHMSHASLGLM